MTTSSTQPATVTGALWQASARTSRMAKHHIPSYEAQSLDRTIKQAVYETELRLSRQRWLPNLRHNFCLFLDTPFRPVDPVGSCRSNYDNIEAALDTLMEDMRNSQCFAMRARPNVVSETVAIDHHLCSPVRPSANVDPAHVRQVCSVTVFEQACNPLPASWHPACSRQQSMRDCSNLHVSRHSIWR
jgi:hypothetical protein